MDAKEGAASACMLLSVMAVPLLLFFGLLCSQGSPMIDLPHDQKSDAAWGCYGSAVLYAATFFGAHRYMAKAREQASARQVVFHQELSAMSEAGR